MALLKLEGLGKRYRQGEVDVQALQDINFSVEEGEFAALVGPSGSGKTTLLNIIGGLDTPSHGSVHLNDTDITALSEAELSDFRLFQLGFIFQAYNLVPVLTALENVELVMVMQGRHIHERRERAEHYLELVGLTSMMHRRHSALSGGQPQRVAVARALVGNPDVIFADEPTAALDRESGANVVAMIKRLGHERGTTTVMVTHDNRILDQADRVITLEDGRIVDDTL